MERNYVQAPVYPTKPQREEHLPAQPKRPTKGQNSSSLNSTLFTLATYFKIPFSIISSAFIGTRRRTPFQHQEKDAPKKLRQAIGERLTEIVEEECEDPKRIRFRVTTKSGKEYRAHMRPNYSGIVGHIKRV